MKTYNKTMAGLLAVCCLLLAACPPLADYLYADIFKTPGTAGAPFLKIGTSARAESMGGMFAGMSDDVSAIEYNPGALAQLKENSVSLTHIVWFNDITLDTVLFGYKSGKSAYGLGGTILSAEDYARTKVDDPVTETSTISQGERILQQNLLGIFTYSYGFDKTNVGFSVKYIGQQLYKSQSSALAADAGILFKSADKRTGYGISLQNLGGAIGPDALPAAVRFGIGRREDGFNVTLDAVQFIDSKIKYGGGIEIFFGRFLTMRGGGVLQNEFNFTAGLGFNFGSVKIDYAYLPHAALGQAHRATLLIGFGAPKPGKLKPANAAQPVFAQQTGEPAVQALNNVLGKQSSASGGGQNKVSLAVIAFTGKEVTAEEALNASGIIREEIDKTGKFTVVGGQNQPEADQPTAGTAPCSDGECAAKAGKSLNVKKVIFGVYAKYGDRRVVTANMVDVETGEIIKSFGQEITSPDGLKEACRILALKLSL